MGAQAARVTLAPRPLLYNPSQHPREDLKRLFVVRTRELSELVNRVRAVQDSAQHCLLIGNRGMGKTTLLYRLAYAIEDDPELSREWLPVTFDEELYSLGKLADLWLGCLDLATGDSHYRESQRIARLREGHSSNENLEELEKVTLEELENFSKHKNSKNGKILLLIDNIDTVLDRLNKNEQRRLRETLISQDRPWLVVIGTASQPVEAAFDYDSPFYELFQIVELSRLDIKETLKLLRSLGDIYGESSKVEIFLKNQEAALENMHYLIDGNPRTIIRLFSVLRTQPGAELATVLLYLLDQHSSDYRDRIDVLPTQGQRVFDTLAQHWNPATAEQIAGLLRIDRGAASAQLHRLVERGLVRKVQTPERPMGFLIRERLFNIWCLMRGARRNKQRLRNLLEFLGALHNRRSGRRKDFRRFFKVLQLLSLVDTDLNEKFASRAREPEAQTRSLFPDMQGRESARVSLLLHLSRDQYAEAERSAQYLLDLEPSSLLAQLARTYALEKLGRYEEAIRLLEECIAKGDESDWLRIEQARLLLGHDQADEASQVVFPLTTTSNLPPEQLATAALDLVRAPGGSSIAWLAQRLSEKAGEAASESLGVLLAQCRMALDLEQVDRALQLLRTVLGRYREDASRQETIDVLDLVLEIASTDRHVQVLELLHEEELTETWLPLTYALKDLQDPEAKTLERLAPELRAFTEQVLARIQKDRT